MRQDTPSVVEEAETARGSCCSSLAGASGGGRQSLTAGGGTRPWLTVAGSLCRRQEKGKQTETRERCVQSKVLSVREDPDTTLG